MYLFEEMFHKDFPLLLAFYSIKSIDDVALNNKIKFVCLLFQQCLDTMNHQPNVG